MGSCPVGVGFCFLYLRRFSAAVLMFIFDCHSGGKHIDASLSRYFLSSVLNKDVLDQVR